MGIMAWGGGGSKGSKFKTVKVVKLNSALNLKPFKSLNLTSFNIDSPVSVEIFKNFSHNGDKHFVICSFLVFPRLENKTELIRSE